MAKRVYKGTISARIVELRFALSGKVTKFTKRSGDTIKKGELIASLDRKILQTELDRQLADYERVRADFDVYGLTKGEPTDELSKYLKTQKQAQLNASVKDVEIAKARLDQCDIVAPINGIVIDDNGVVPGIYITPAGASIKVVDINSYCFVFNIKQDEIDYFSEPKEASINLDGIDKDIKGLSKKPYSDSKNLILSIFLDSKYSDILLLGLNGKAYF